MCVYLYIFWYVQAKTQVPPNWSQLLLPSHHLFCWKSCSISVWPVLYQAPYTHLLPFSSQETNSPILSGKQECFPLTSAVHLSPRVPSLPDNVAFLTFKPELVFLYECLWDVSPSPAILANEFRYLLITFVTLHIPLLFLTPRATPQRSASGPRPLCSHLREVPVCLVTTVVWAVAYGICLKRAIVVWASSLFLHFYATWNGSQLEHLWWWINFTVMHTWSQLGK